MEASYNCQFINNEVKKPISCGHYSVKCQVFQVTSTRKLPKMAAKNNILKRIAVLMICALISNPCIQVHAFFGLIVGIIEFGWTLYEIASGVSEAYTEEPTISDVMGELADVTDTVNQWGEVLEEKMDAIESLIRQLPTLISMDNDIRALTGLIGRIDELYTDYVNFAENPGDYSTIAVDGLIKAFVSRDGDDVIATIEQINALVIPGRMRNFKTSIILLIAAEIQGQELNGCREGLPQQKLLDFSQTLIITEIRAYTMTTVGYILDGLKKNESRLSDIKRKEKQLKLRVQNYMLLIRNAIQIAPQYIRSCDPPAGYQRGTSFHEFEKFMQGFVTELYQVDTCSNSCDSIANPTRMVRSRFPHRDRQSKCHGKIHDCVSLGAQADYCLNFWKYPRRYEWIRNESHGYHPEGTHECNAIQETVPYIDNCPICHCICAETSMAMISSRFISLREQLSDVEDNKVIVGMQFSIVDRIAFIDILQGEIGKNAIIDEDTVEWKQAERLIVNDEESRKQGSVVIYKEDDDGSQEKMVPNEDFAALTWKQRRIYLDRLTAPPRHVITGIQFIREVDKAENPIYLQIKVTPYDYDTGRMTPKNSRWIGPKDTPYGKSRKERSPHPVGGFDNPAKSRATVIDSKPNSYVDFEWTSWDLDLSQTTVPVLDGVPVFSDPLVALGGVGLYSKKEEGYGGFLTLILEAFDVTEYFVEEKKEQVVKKKKSWGSGARS